MKYNPDIHHRKSTRLKEYDYSSDGSYFVTIICKDRECLIESEPAREIVQSVWNQLPKRFSSIELDEFIIMPNHVHGIITIRDGGGTGPMLGAIHESPLQNELPLRTNLKRRRLMTLSKVIGYFKMNTAKQINRIQNRTGHPFWQRNYYDHVIRDEYVDRFRD